MENNNTISLEDTKDFVRDSHSKALLSTNKMALEASNKKIESSNKLNNDINNMKEEIDGIKNIQQELLTIIKKYIKDN